jgi:hypothetical protein
MVVAGLTEVAWVDPMRARARAMMMKQRIVWRGGLWRAPAFCPVGTEGWMPVLAWVAGAISCIWLDMVQRAGRAHGRSRDRAVGWLRRSSGLVHNGAELVMPRLCSEALLHFYHQS